MDNRMAREIVYKNTPALFLGIMMILSGLVMTVIRFVPIELWGVNFSRDEGPLGVISRLMLIGGGLIIVYYRNKGNYFAIGVYALVLGISRCLRSLPNLVLPSNPQNDVIFYITIVVVLLSVNLALTGYNHLTVRMKNPITMRYTTAGIITMYSIVLLFFLYIKKSPDILMEYLPDTIWYIPLYFALLLILFSLEVSDNCPMGRLARFSREMADKLNLGDVITVSGEDAAKIREGFGSHEGWTERSAGDVRIYEESITFSTVRGDRYVVLERCDSDGDLRITVMDDATDSFITGCRIRASSYSESDGTIELRDRLGVCATLFIGGGE